MGENRAAARQSSEYTAKTEQEAVEQACTELRIPAGQLEYEVVRDTTRTLFGLVRTGDVTIRVRRPVSDGDALADPVEAPSAEPPEPASVEPVESEGDTEEAAPKDAEVTPEPEPAATPESDRNPAELEDVATEVVSTLLDKMGMLAAIEVVDHGGILDASIDEVSPLILNIVGDDLGMLIGRRGETLRDLQFISRLIISRRLGTWPNLVVDVEGYKARREETLRSLALRMRDEVVRTGRTVMLEPMPAHERRIVHITLRNDPDVYTQSTGEDDHRKVQVLLR